MELKKYKLGEIGEIRMCKRILKSETNPYFGIPFYKIGTFGKIADAFIDPLLYKHYKKSYSFPRKGDVLISAAGTIGKSVIYNGEDAYFQDSNIVWIEHDQSIVLNEFLYYLLNSIQWIPSIGSTIFRLYDDDIRNKEVFLPSIKEQRGIVSVLSSIDRKIELNRTINQNLEKMIADTMDYMFLSNKHLMQKRLVSDIAVIKAGGDCPTEWSKCKTDEFKVPIYSNGTDNEGLYGYAKEAVISDRSITVAARGTIGYCVLREGGYTPIIRLLAVTPNDIGGDVYLHQIFSRIKFKKDGSIQQQLTVPSLASIEIPYPNASELMCFAQKTFPIIDKIKQNKQQIVELAKQRDELLPLLMNGQISP